MWLNSAPKKVCEQLSHALESTTEEMEKLNADYSKLSELMYDISVPYNDGDLSDLYVDLRLDKLNGILKPVGFEGDEIYWSRVAIVNKLLLSEPHYRHQCIAVSFEEMNALPSFEYPSKTHQLLKFSLMFRWWMFVYHYGTNIRLIPNLHTNVETYLRLIEVMLI